MAGRVHLLRGHEVACGARSGRDAPQVTGCPVKVTCCSCRRTVAWRATTAALPPRRVLVCSMLESTDTVH